MWPGGHVESAVLGGPVHAEQAEPQMRRRTEILTADQGDIARIFRMPSYRFREAAELLGVSDDSLRRWADGGRVATSVDGAGRRVIDGAELARFAEQNASPMPEARTIARESARNRFVGLVTRVARDQVMAQVEMQCGPYRVVSLMSREAADELGLEPGVSAVASVKSTNVVVEVPEARS
jgi:molybdopterin-binding protein